MYVYKERCQLIHINNKKLKVKMKKKLYLNIYSFIRIENKKMQKKINFRYIINLKNLQYKLSALNSEK